MHFCPPLLCDSFLSMIQLLTSYNVQLTKENLLVYTFRRNRICIGCFCIPKHSVWSLRAVWRAGISFSITLSALSSFLLNRALHLQVSSPGNSLTAGAVRVVTVMHGHTALQRAGRLRGVRGKRGEEVRGQVERKA